MSARLVYDSSWNGLLTTFNHCLNQDIQIAEIVSLQTQTFSLFGEPVIVNTNLMEAGKLKEYIKKRMGENPLRLMYHAWLSEERSIEDALYQYLLLGLREGKKFSNFLTNEYVLHIETLAKKVMREKHRYLGLLRFTTIQDDILLAEFEPDYFILPLLAKPFFDRLGSEDFIIFDKKRKKILIKEQGNLYFQTVDDELISSLKTQQDDKTYENLWITYFKTIAITLRHNLKLQRSRVPFKCVPYLTESTAIQEEYGLGRD
jgi:probable DNA metabolism protein